MDRMKSCSGIMKLVSTADFVISILWNLNATCFGDSADIVYIGTITSKHYPLAKLSLKHGKHVLCEKPLCVNVKETRDLVEYAKKKKLFLMEVIFLKTWRNGVVSVQRHLELAFSSVMAIIVYA